MTVLSESSKIAYIGSSSQTLYPIPFEYINTDDIKVSIYTSNNEFVEDWTYSVQYVIEGRNVKVLSGYNIDNTKKLLVLRRVDLVQDNKYREGGDFPAKSTETSFDKLTMITQQLQETLDRCVKVEVLDIQSPEELLQTVYDKLDSATEIAGDAISAANQAQTAADNATAAVNSAEQTLVQTQAYVDSAKVEINNTKNTAINTINSTVAQAKTDINTAVSNAESNISTIVSDAEGSITNIAVTEANKAIANAAQEATDMATANVNSYVNGTILPPLQNYVNQAQEDANSAAASMEQAALSATAASNYASNASADADNAAESAALAANSAIWAEGTDSEVQAIGGVHSSKGWSETAQAVVDGKQDIATAVNYDNITNCITEISQDIKLELNNGTLTLKAGSKVYVPNGVGVFNVVNITTDRTLISNTLTGKYFLFITGSDLLPDVISIQSGDTFPSSATASNKFYNTTENKIYRYSGSEWLPNGYSLPLAIITLSSGSATSIDQVFNGFGYIGSTVFALPGVKGLIPNGRNADGTLKNIEFTLDSVNTATRTWIDADSLQIWGYVKNPPTGIIETWYWNRYIESDEEPSKNEYTMWYKPSENITYMNNGAQSSTPNWEKVNYINFGKASGVNSQEIKIFNPKTAFHAVDYNDRETVVGWGMPDYSAGISLNISEASYTAPKDGIICLYVYFGQISYNQDITINGVFFGHLRGVSGGEWEGNGYSIIIPVSKGDIVAGLPTYTSNSPKRVFYPLRGAN